MKTIIITESQKERLFEAADGTFSLDDLDNIKSLYGRSRYCREHIGLPIGQGSSRDVYQLDDEKVLKLARNEKGVAQNNEEGRDYYKRSCDVFPMVFDIAMDSSWVVSEFVLSATEEDFQHVFGMPFRVFCTFITASVSQVNDEVNRYFKCASHDDLIRLVNNNQNFADIDSYIRDYNPPPQDLLDMQNYGLAMRNGKAYIVILDSGFTYQIWNQYYKPKTR